MMAVRAPEAVSRSVDLIECLILCDEQVRRLRRVGSPGPVADRRRVLWVEAKAHRAMLAARILNGGCHNAKQVERVVGRSTETVRAWAREHDRDHGAGWL